MYVIKVDYLRLPQISKFEIHEFDIGSSYLSLPGRYFDEHLFCRDLLGDYPVDKYRVTLKRKFKAKGYNNGKGPHFYCFGIIKPMVFINRDDAEKALEWVESIYIHALLNKN